MFKLSKLVLAAFVMTGFAIPLAVPSEAHAAICDGPRTVYTISNARRTYRASNLVGDWMEAGFHASYAKNTTAQVSASITTTLSAEAGVIFAKASASLAVQLGGSWSRGQTWTYTGPVVPRGKLGRVVMYHESRAFSVTKESLRAPCRYVVVARGSAEAPTRNGANVWRMQYRADSGRAGAPSADGEVGQDGFDEEVELGPDQSGGEEDDTGSFDDMPEELTIAVPETLDLALTAGVKFYSLVVGALSAVTA